MEYLLHFKSETGAYTTAPVGLRKIQLTRSEFAMSQSLYARLVRRHAPRAASAGPLRRQNAQRPPWPQRPQDCSLSNCGIDNKQTGFGWAKAKRKVIVIGAGFSGLACAYELDAAGYEVTVIEALQPRRLSASFDVR